MHAYLHRKERDLGNAAYWYTCAGRIMPRTTLGAEWRALAEELLEPSLRVSSADRLYPLRLGCLFGRKQHLQRLLRPEQNLGQTQSVNTAVAVVAAIRT